MWNSISKIIRGNALMTEGQRELKAEALATWVLEQLQKQKYVLRDDAIVISTKRRDDAGESAAIILVKRGYKVSYDYGGYGDWSFGHFIFRA